MNGRTREGTDRARRGRLAREDAARPRTAQRYGRTDQSNSRCNLVNVIDVIRQPASVFSYVSR